MTKSVGILTYHNVYNLGAVLQAFALQRTIQSLGHACKIIDFASPVHGTAYDLFDFRLSQFSGLRASYGSMIRNLRVLAHLRSHLALRRRFAQFQSRHLTLTSETYHSASEVRTDCPSFDVFVIGSDQVWEPSGLDCGSGTVFYLEFVSSGRRVAYAPSFGVAEMPLEYHERIAALLNRFDVLSAREDSGCRIIQQLTGREAAHVVDPSLLLRASDYRQVAIAPSQGEPCVLLYPMLSSDRLKVAARKASKCLKLPLVAVVPIYYNPQEYAFADRVVFDSGPAEFLGWLNMAAFVCTNSFHGLAFSLIYRKPFLTVPYHVPSFNLRLESLLAKVGLLSRQLTHGQELRPEDSLLGPVDYAPVEARLMGAIDESLNFLKKALA